MRPEGNRSVRPGTGAGLSCLLSLALILNPVSLLGRPQNDPSPDLGQEPSSTFQDGILPILQTRCLGCHSRKVRTGGLSLESQEEALEGGGRGPAIVPGQPEQSRLIRAVSYRGELKMPPGGKLPDSEIKALERWVVLGAPWGEADLGMEGHWSFQPIRRPPEPRVRQPEWVRNPIDRFILAKLEEHGLQPSPEAAPATLLRRLSLDLVGLPPSLAEIDAFLSDRSPAAYGRVIDRLLSSEHYGERWGRRWLDVARYADSDGFADGPRQIWMYRDWVIEAFNRDLPFDQFAIEQLAGDLLPEASKTQRVATGFHRNTVLNLEGGVDVEQYRVEAVVDRVETTGAAFLGLTLGCARCHDHKYDPISQREFFQFYAFFNNVDEKSPEWEGKDKPKHWPLLEFGEEEEFARRDVIRAQLQLLTQELEGYEIELLSRLPQWQREMDPEARRKLKPEIQRILDLPVDQRNEIQTKTLKDLYKEMDLGYSTRLAGIQALEAVEPKLKSTLVMEELATPREAYIHLGGEFNRRGDLVEPDVPAVLPPLSSSSRPTRLDLARWLVDPENPLTARVTVNRIWQRYFGTGLVDTENDFGTQGSLPSHPLLLDWLASELVRRNWSLKALHRLIVTSATYRQSSRYRPELERIDPGNRLLARQHRLRLESEVVRDVCLAASGLLNREIGGPSVFPPQPKGVSKLGHIQREWKASSGKDRYRRGLYTHFWRSTPHPALMVFDSSNGVTSCTRRSRSNTPLQALTLLNDEAFYEFAQGLARRLMVEAPQQDSERIDYAFRVCLTREPTREERSQLEKYLSQQREDLRADPAQAHTLVPSDPEANDVPELAAWTLLSSVLLNLDEFITRE